MRTFGAMNWGVVQNEGSEESSLSLSERERYTGKLMLKTSAAERKLGIQSSPSWETKI